MSETKKGFITEIQTTIDKTAALTDFKVQVAPALPVEPEAPIH
jgi:hypothetical protein